MRHHRVRMTRCVRARARSVYVSIPFFRILFSRPSVIIEQNIFGIIPLFRHCVKVPPKNVKMMIDVCVCGGFRYFAVQLAAATSIEFSGSCERNKFVGIVKRLMAVCLIFF